MEVGLIVYIFPLLMLAVLLLLGFWIWMLVDCATKESSEGNDKLTWILIILIANWVGALVYFFVRRPQRRRMC